MSPVGRSYCDSRMKRSVDILLALAGLVLSLPLLVAIALAVLITSGRPVLFRQRRIGQGGRPFTLVKFRTMRNSVAAGLPITASGDRRVTPIGRILRATKLDELPQLFNVVAGDMSLVGPRPEVPEYVARYSESQRLVLTVKPGVTDPASIAFRDEETLLGRVPGGRREGVYLEEIVPRKLALNLEYIEAASFRGDIRILVSTIFAILRPRRQ